MGIKKMLYKTICLCHNLAVCVVSIIQRERNAKQIIG